MKRYAYLAGACALAFAGTPARAAQARAPAQATIVDAMSVRMSWPMAMPSVQGGASGAAFMGQAPSMGMGMMTPTNATMLMVRREDQTGQPITAPASFEVVTTGGNGALIVKTGVNTQVEIARDGAIVGGSLLGGAAASIEVARGLSASASAGPLVVVVQYN